MVEGAELRGRRSERDALDRLLREVRGGRSRVLVLRGEAGTGKSALLDHLVERSAGCQVIRAAGNELESDLAFSTLQQLCAPLLGRLDRLPEPQRDALSTAFGLSAGRPPQGLLIGLAVLGLFAEAAAEQPLVCVVDDVQWLDRMSETILSFVARRLDAEAVAVIFGARTPDGAHLLAGLPELTVEGLPDADARLLLDSVLTGPVDDRVRDRIIAETRGNPLALLELPRGLSPAELAFGFGAASRMPIAGRVEEGFARRIAGLPVSSRRLLLTAALEPVGDVPLLWRALARLDVKPDAVAAAEFAGLITIDTRVRFRHPLVRSAAWRSAPATELREVHRALAEVTDRETEPDRRAWHLAHAALGPDEEVAGELERSAGRALARGGRSAAAAFLERAAELSVDPDRRAALLLGAAQALLAAGIQARTADLLGAAELGAISPRRRVEIELLRARLAFSLDPGRSSLPGLLAVAAKLETSDPATARVTYLTAVGAALHAGRLGQDDLRPVAEAARRLAPADDFPGRMLTGLTTWALDGPRAAAAPLRRALDALAEDEHLGFLWLAAPAAHELLDLDTTHRITGMAVRFARATGEQSLLPTALSYHAGTLLFMGRFADAADLLDEGERLSVVTGIPGPQFAAITLAACRGRAQPARAAFDRLIADARARGEGRLLGLTAYATAVLHNGLGEHRTALAAARECAEYPDIAIDNWNLPELVEAAALTGETAAATAARDRLADRAAVTNTDWARGWLALADALLGRGEEHFTAAADRLDRAGLAFPAARARLLHGEWLSRAGRPAAAREQLRPAYEAFTVMGAEAFGGRAERALAGVGETIRKPPAEADGDLTAQQAQIARLAAAGRTNAEIGAAMFLSPRTVEWHMGKVLGKLSISSRRGLADALRDRF